jgi:hypothetical protein
MNQPIFTATAITNGQRRAVPHWVTALLLQEGARAPAGGGMQFLYFDAAARARVLRRARRGEFAIGKLDHAWDAWAVVARGLPVVISVGHRDRRVWRA